MPTLHKFKLLASHCAVAASPTRSPNTSPAIHLRKRKTLRMLLGRAGCGGGRRLQDFPDEVPPDRSKDGRSQEKGKELSISNKLKDLFVSSPPGISEDDVREGLLRPILRANRGPSFRPLSATLRQRLLRRVWRPVLIAIPE